MSLYFLRIWNRFQIFFLRFPSWIQILLVFALSRLWGLIVFAMVARQQSTNPWTTGKPSYLEFISFWDSGWYRQIAIDGYPIELPKGADGTVLQNTWAFYPIFPLLAGALNSLTGIGFYAVAALLATISSFLSALVLYRLLQEALGKTSWGQKQEPASRHILLLWSVTLFGFLPVSAILQVPYAESFNLLFLMLTLLYLLKGDWLLALPTALITCLSRPVGVPLGAAAGLYWVGCAVQMYRQRMKADAGSSSPTSYIGYVLQKTWLQLLSALVICGFALLWPAIAWYRTGRIDAYTATETAWRGQHLAPIAPWFNQAERYLGIFSIPAVLILVAGFYLLLYSPIVRRTLPHFLITWCACYFAYLLLFLNPQSSTFRLLLPLFPLVLVLMSASTSRAYRWCLVICCALGQLWWVSWLWHWKQLPGGGDFPP